MDIETAATLLAENRTNLAQAKSKVLSCTLITGALTSGKCWDDIKDLLCLKICNSDIHSSVGCFMEIQQQEKESLQHIFITLKEKPKDVTLPIAQPQ